MSDIFKFPQGFLWGAATSSHQVEGGNRNDWTEWEQANTERLAAEAASKFSYLKNWSEIRAQAKDPANYISGRAADHYYRFREDFDIAQSLGHNAHRFSIEWSRIEPEEGKFDEREIEHYREVIQALRERGLEPFVTLWHWTLPVWVAKQGGWENPKTISCFSRFCEKIASELKNEVRFWIPLNEPGILVGYAYILGLWPPQKRNIIAAIRAYFNLIKAHQEVYPRLKNINPNFVIGIAEATTWFKNWWSRPLVHHFKNFFFMGRVRNQLDFVGINYYKRTRLGFCRKCDASDMGWEIYPEGLYGIIMEAWSRYHKPIFITENGIADARDIKRAEFIRAHLGAVSRVAEGGVELRGYFHWGLLDNFEWHWGFWPRFGLLEVDYKTLERKIRPSAWEYKKIIEANAVEVEADKRG